MEVFTHPNREPIERTPNEAIMHAADMLKHVVSLRRSADDWEAAGQAQRAADYRDAATDFEAQAYTVLGRAGVVCDFSRLG